MRVKEIDRTANIAWSPTAHHPIYLAAGTAAQQLDATFSTTASLEIYDLNLTEPGLDMCLKGSIKSDFRLHKLIWGCIGTKSSEKASGVLVGGADGGNLLMYDPAKLLSGEDAILHHKTKHTGAVRALDFNKFQDCLLASGANDSEIYIWDLNNPSSPMAPGAKSQPPDDVTSVAWNCQVQHILASTFPARCVVWDLRKNEPIIKVSDSASRLRCKMVAWHPEIATQLCIASDDDHCPLIQLWDLRFATTPVRHLERHQRGVLSIAWCPHDPDLLLSCGKDNKIFCWNPNSSVEGGEVICELPSNNQWCFDVSWCLRNPAIIASSACDGRVSVFSLMGGQQQVHCSSKIAESFPGSDKMTAPTISPSSQRQAHVSLKKPPKWLRKPIRSSFGFGGKLVSFVNEPPPAHHGGSPFPKVVYISQVVTEPELLTNSAVLENALNAKNFHEFCQSKIENCNDVCEKTIWTFLQATFSPSPRTKMLSLLGYDGEKVKNEVKTKIYSEDRRKSQETEELSAGLGNLRTSSVSPTYDHQSSFDAAAIKTQDFDESFHIITTSDCQDGLLCKTLLSGNIEAAVKLCIQEQRWADAILLAQASGPDLLCETKKMYCKSVSSNSSKLICAIGTSDWISVIRCCAIDCWKEIFAAILTYAKPEEFVQLCELLGSRLETEKEGTFMSNAALCYISSGNLQNLAQCWAKCYGKKICASALQDLVEKIMILQSAVEYLSGSAPAIQNGELAFYLGLYASILASQGNLASAAMYLADSKEQSLAILKDRVYQALGHHSPYFPFNVVDVQKTSNFNAPYQLQQRVRPESVPPFQTQIQQHSTPYQQQQQQQQQIFFPERKLPFQPQYNYGDMSDPSMPHCFPGGVPNSSIPSSVPPLPTSSLPVHTSVPPPSVDAASNSPGKNITCGQHHMSQRYPKHVYDSSVYSDNTYNQQYYSVSQAQPSSFIMQNTSQQSTMSYYSTETNTSAPCSSGTGNVAHNTANAYTFSPTNYGTQVPMSSFPETAPPPAVMPGLPSMYGEMKTGWNDPPLLRRESGAISASAYDTPPITVPLMGDSIVDVPQVASLPAENYNPTYNVPAQIQPVNAMKEPITTAPLPTPAPPAKAVEPPKEKGPIPPEHQQLYDIFEDLRHKCVQVARNPQVKRKLEDVAKKLEYLYDQLRENTLSEPVLFGLHQIIQAVMKNDYQATLGIHGHIVSTTNFSEISGFMPSIKVLLQTASQLGVYLQ